MVGALKILIGIFALLAILVSCQSIRNSGTKPLPPKTSATLRMATLNVHYIILSKESGAWSVEDWERRKGPLDLAFKKINSDVMAFQEMESFQRSHESDINLTLDWLLERNPDYAAAAVGDPSAFPSTQPIFYRQDMLELLDQGWFFFSDTPDVIYSRTFNGSFPAFASTAKFRHRATGKDFHVVNVHFEFKSFSNRRLSAELVTSRIAPLIKSGEQVFVMGDLNARKGDEAYEILKAAGIDFANIPGSTYHFNGGINLFGAIDHIGVSGGAEVLGEPIVLRQKFDGEWPTDHYPVIVDFALTQ